jgi:osmotically-inducible protein OsmY
MIYGASTSDETIQSALRDRLRWEPEVEGVAIAVSVANGVATLAGTVRAYQRAAAERVARDTAGVTAVENRLRVSDPLRLDDEGLAAVLMAALAEESIGVPDEVTVAVHDGVVELSGQVSSGRARLAAQEAAVDLPGVVDVQNRIVVTSSPVHAARVERAIRDAFAAAAADAAVGITVAVAGSRVALAGTAPTDHYRHLAEEAAWGVEGVGAVRNEIQVAL